MARLIFNHVQWLRCPIAVGIALLIFARVAWAQTSATAIVSGIVTDPTGAVVSGASVELLDTATNQTRKQTTNEAGQYVFTQVLPGTYKLTVTMAGFRQVVIPSIRVEVARTYTVNVTLEVGEMVETVEVTAGPAIELQTSDASVGNVLGGEILQVLTNLKRDATTLLLLQPTAMPGRGVGTNFGGQVAGARSDQNTFLLDGGEVTSNVEGTGGYNTNQAGEPRAVVPTPVESLEEFRVTTNNPTAAFARSAGGQVLMVTKRGTNDLHGSVYWYHQNDNLNANTWDFNRVGIRKPELKDNRFGASAGGPIIKDKTFIFGHYEGRRFPRTATITRLVPTDTLRQGILRFRDAAGNIVSYDLKTSRLCGDGTQPCDPRGLGLSPVVRALWNLLPAGNDFTLGDGLNTIGFRAPADNSLTEDFAVVRLDHSFTQNWRFMASFRYARTKEPDVSQVDIAGLISKQPGKAVPVAASPLEPRYVVAGLTGTITPNLTNDFRFSWYRHWWEWQRTSPFPQVPGTTGALQLAGEPGLVDEPINIDTQRARSRVWNGRVTVLKDDLTWLRGRHMIQLGGRFTNDDTIHSRNDKVIGSLSSLVYFVDARSALTIPASFRPPTCSDTIRTNCLAPGDVSRWNSLYAAVLGLVDNASVLITRDAQLRPNPLGQPLRIDTRTRQFDLYAADTWRLRPSLTLSYGLSWVVQRPITERDGLQTLMIFRDTGKILEGEEYFRRRRDAALRGEIFNPDIAFVPIRQSGRSRVYDTDWNNLAPRIALAWNPSFQEGWAKRLWGDRKTVFRGGYAVMYDRLNGVGLVMIPILGVGFGQTVTCQGPRIDGTCAGSSDPTNGFRIGIDGSTVPLPTLPPGKVPIEVPAPFGEILSFQLDPKLTVGLAHTIDFTIQRELPGSLLLELGYVGRFGRNLQQSFDLTAAPYFHRDPRSGQTFAQAFDAVATALRLGQAVTPQPWFENQIGAGATQSLASRFTSQFINGAISTLWRTGIDVPRFRAGAQPFNNIQMQINWIRLDPGRSNYNAGFISLRKRMSHGLYFDINYTLSHSLDNAGVNQQFIATNATPFDLDVDYGPSLFDRRHVLSSLWLYDLPFGRGRRFATGTWADKLLGGWYISGIFTANSGLPLCVTQGGEVWAGGSFNTQCAIPIRKPEFGNSVHSGVAGSGGVGTVGDPARRGSGLNLFANPEAAFKNFRRAMISQDRRHGRGALRGLPRWNMDLSVGKRTLITETVAVRFVFDFANVFNRVEFNDPALDLRNPAAFGVITSQFNQPRFIQFGLRVEF